MNYDINQSELLIFRAVVEPRNSAKSAKSYEIHKNAQNTAKFSRNLIKYMSVQHIWNLYQLLGLFTCRKPTNLPWNFVTEMCDQVVFCLFVFFGKGEKECLAHLLQESPAPLMNTFLNICIISVRFYWKFKQLQRRGLLMRNVFIHFSGKWWMLSWYNSRWQKHHRI